jgi:hypothetical protein
MVNVAAVGRKEEDRAPASFFFTHARPPTPSWTIIK